MTTHTPGLQARHKLPYIYPVRKSDTKGLAPCIRNTACPVTSPLPTTPKATEQAPTPRCPPPCPLQHGFMALCCESSCAWNGTSQPTSPPVHWHRLHTPKQPVPPPSPLHPAYPLHHGHVLQILMGLEQRVTSGQLRQDAAQAPQVAREGPAQAQDHLWRAVVARGHLHHHIARGPRETRVKKLPRAGGF